jgi:hypothetical protein
MLAKVTSRAEVVIEQRGAIVSYTVLPAWSATGCYGQCEM